MTEHHTIAQQLSTLVGDTLKAYQGEDIVTLEVKALTCFFDYVVICTSHSKPHIHALTHHVVEAIKTQSYPVQGIEGQDSAEWILIDLGNVIVHIMQKDIRDFYQLEKLWSRL